MKKDSRPLFFVLVLMLATWTWGQVSQPTPTDALEQQAARLTEELGEQQDRLRLWAGGNPDAVARRSDDLALAMLKLEKAELLLARYRQDEFRNQTARKFLEEGKRLLELLETSGEFPPEAPGFVERAYISDIDGSTQPYSLYVPETLDPNRPTPLILFLHGYVANLDKVNWMDLTFPAEYPKLAVQTNAIVLAPFARSNTDFQGVGEADVVQTIRRTLARTHTDPDRVFLGGVSMGGSGVWTIASHHPDLFAGIFLVAGRTDYYLWKGLEPRDFPRHQRWLIDKEFAISVPGNFLNLPARVYHTREDILISVEHSRRMDRALREAGAPCTYVELVEGNHWTWSQSFGDPKLVEWIKETVRRRFPPTVRLKVYDLHANRAYWTAIERIERWGTPGQLSARRVSPELIEVKTENVGALTLTLDRRGLDLASSVTVDVDGKKSKVDVTEQTVFTTLSPETDVVKRKGLCGPIADVFGGKFLLVFGTGGDKQAAQAGQAGVVKTVQDWYSFAAGMPRVKQDTAVDDRDIAESHLILFGTPKTNTVLERLAPKLPVRFEAGKFVLGKEEYPDTLGLMMIYPNPLNPERYVVVCSGLHYGEGLSVNHKYDLLPDYIVFEDVFVREGENRFRCAGFFDSRWRLDESLMDIQRPLPAEQEAPANP